MVLERFNTEIAIMNICVPRNLSLPFLLAGMLIAGCQSSPVDVFSDYDPAADFASLKTYGWYNEPVIESGKPFKHANDIVDQRIRINIDANLAGKGFTQTGADSADFQINYGVTKEKQMDVRNYHTYGGYAPGFNYYGGYGYGRYGRHAGVGLAYNTGVTETQVTYYEQGTLIVDVINPASDTLVWRGIAKGRIQDKLSAEERDTQIAEIINGIMETFPPQKPVQ